MGVLQAVSSIGQGMQAREFAERNAVIDEQDAAIALDEARSRAAIEQRVGQRIRAEQAVRFAGSGIAPGTGTPLQLAAQEVVNADLRAASQLRQGTLEASRRTQSAALNRFRGRSARTAGFIGALQPFVNPLRSLGSKASQGALSLQASKANRRFQPRAGEADLFTGNFSTAS